MRSNITISSNIYVRESKRIQKDADFVKNVTGRTALTVLKAALSDTLCEVKLAPVQQEEISKSTACTHAKNNERTHGKVFQDGEIRWVCRCEYHQCPHFETCQERLQYPQITRTTKAVSRRDEPMEMADVMDFEYLGLDFRVTGPAVIFNEPEPEEALFSERDEPAQLDTLQSGAFFECAAFAEIKDPAVIIEAAIDSKILVNAGPGTGKTYTVIQRLFHILSAGLAEPHNILVLCYTRAAKAVIVERIEANIKMGKLPLEARRLHVYTFDSLATNYLAEIEESFQDLDYNQRIDLFNATITRDLFDDFEYLIVDEIQDLVNGRAAMVINMLNNMDCGMLLLGDRCQAIYDYDCQVGETINSTMFYEMLTAALPVDVLKYELIKNNRQTDELASLSNEIRQSLLYSEISEQNQFVLKTMQNRLRVSDMTAEKLLPVIKNQQKTAILCRNNGEAESISSLLHRNKIDHLMLRGSNQPIGLHRWLADVFWDFCEAFIGKSDFIKRYCVRVKDCIEEAEARFQLLGEVCGSHDSRLVLNDLSAALARLSDIPGGLSCNEDKNLVVSTIHRAKGREFDKVYLLDSDFAVNAKHAEEARVRYVGMTRPREEIELVRKRNAYNWFFCKNISGRTVKTMRRFYSNKTKYCCNLFVGLKSDLDMISFVSKKHPDPLAIQEYISEKIKVHDELEMIRDVHTDLYSIYHQGFYIGSLSKYIADDFWNAVYKTDDRRNIPLRLYDVYVSHITTVVNNRYDENIPLQYRESKMWLGLEVAGLAKIEYPN